jgi:DNA uptake protein ComE-like DNA-binding protein
MYEAVALWLLLSVVAVMTLLRYQQSRPRWRHIATIPLTGAVTTAALPTPATPRLNLNQATIAQLCTLPGISESTAWAIAAVRAQTPLRNVAELLQFGGIGEKRLVQLAARAYCGPVTNTPIATQHAY